MEINLQQIRKSFGATQALKTINLRIRHGEFTTLLGPSGCGKTTLLRCIAGLETPDAGTIMAGERLFFSKQDRFELPTHQRQLGMVFQDFALWPHLNVFENVAFSLRASGCRTNLRSKVHEALERVKLHGMADRYPHQLSGGQQQRVSFARAIVNRPDIILFDEPLSALDALLREEMRLELKSLLQDTAFTAVYVTHDQAEAMAISDRIIVMNQGQVLQADTPEAIYHHPADEFVAKFIGKSNSLGPAGTRLTRPEQISWEPYPNSTPCQGVVSHVSYLGDRYEIRLQLDDERQWLVYHQQRLALGSQVTVFYSEADLFFQAPVS